MKVLQITAFSGWGCTGRIALGINNVLKEKGYDSAIAWGRKNTVQEDIFTIKIGNKYDQMAHGLYTRITDKCGFGSKRVTKEFIKELDEYNPDLIHLHIMHGYYINLEILFQYIKEKNIPVVWTFHDCWAFTGHCPYFDAIGCEKWKTGCYNCKLKSNHPTSWLLDNSSWNYQKKKQLFTGIKNMTIVTPSKWLAGLVKESFLKEYPVVVINNGINLENFKPTKNNFKKEHNIENKKVILGVSSTWCKSKGIDDFVKLSTVLDDNYKVVLVGVTNEQKEKLPDNILAIGRTDSVKELAEIYTAADVFVNLTYEDNYPTTNLEAIACGIPVITYDTGGSVEIIKKTYKGTIVNQGNIDAVNEAILEINKNNGFEINDLEMLLDEKVKFQEYLNLYERIIK